LNGKDFCAYSDRECTGVEWKLSIDRDGEEHEFDTVEFESTFVCERFSDDWNAACGGPGPYDVLEVLKKGGLTT
jgi:hypothetical protein